MQPTKQLFYATVAMDILAVIFSLLINPVFAVGILLYILTSRAYSYRRIRLKRYPVPGFITVFIFQGAVIFFICYHALSVEQPDKVPVLECVVASTLIGALYPLTQIYQHDEDVADGVYTISWRVGKVGTFVLSAIMFVSATVLLYILFTQNQQNHFFLIFIGIMFPVVSFFLWWMYQVVRNSNAANFQNSLRMNVLATVCTSLFFLILIFSR